jgi:chorismate mutase/prephenate dehydratase
MSSALGLQKKLVISYLGPAATFTHEAARLKFGEAVTYSDAANISEIFNSVEKGYADYGVVPIENSIEGIVTHTQDMFIDSNLKICSEIMLEISHNLMSREGDIKGIKRIYSKAEVFGQCRTWIKTTLPLAELIEVASTANAAKKAKEESGSAAIASELAADLYDLNVLARDIEDTPHNVTKFLVIGNNYAGKTGDDKTSIMFSVKDKVGALYDTLKAFKYHKINLTKIESRPSKRKAWEYYFFVDFIGHCEDKKIKKALLELEKSCIFVKILGSYPIERGV